VGGIDRPPQDHEPPPHHTITAALATTEREHHHTHSHTATWMVRIGRECVQRSDFNAPPHTPEPSGWDGPSSTGLRINSFRQTYNYARRQLTAGRLRAIGWSGHGAVTGARAGGQVTDRGSPHPRALIGHANPTSTDRRLARAVTGMGTQRARKPKEHKQAHARAVPGTGTQRAPALDRHGHPFGTTTDRQGHSASTSQKL
jgi:hypothetical protein